jgi:hypothetical protein
MLWSGRAIQGKAARTKQASVKAAANRPVPVSDLATDILDPVLRNRAGMTIGLVQSWEEIVGERLAAITRPEKIVWPRRRDEDDPFEAATLVIACSGAAALRVQHETAEIIARLNSFLGYGAIGRLRIVQKPVAASVRAKPVRRPLDPAETRRIDEVTAPVEDEGLRDSLRRLGENVAASRRKS